mgnify:CR=1 FL=1
MKTLCDCGHLTQEIEKGACTTGYGIDSQGKKICYACCAEQDKAAMRTGNRITLYLNPVNRNVTNWPGSLRIVGEYVREGKHNFAGKRYDVWFTVEGSRWHGVRYGDFTELCHCRKLKA